MTSLDLITRALKAVGIVGFGETVDSDMAADCLDTLNSMIRLWNAENLSLQGTLISAYPLVQGKQTYTIGGPGLGADFDAIRPQKITQVNLIATATTPNVRYPVDIINADQWASIQVQTQPSTLYPSALYDDLAFPLSTLYLWGVPSASLQLELFTWETLSSFPLLTTAFSLPGEYEEAIIYNLAVRLAGILQVTAPPIIIEMAATAKAVLQRYNAVTPIMDCDPMVTLSRRNIFNISSGQ